MPKTNPRALSSLVACLLACSGLAKAGETTSNIKKRFAQAAQLEQSGDSHHQVTFNTVLPAVGLQQTTVRFVYVSEQADPEKDPYLLEHELVKVTVSYNVAASVHHRSEYLYDAKGGLIFQFSKEESEEGLREVRIYFKAGRPFKHMLDVGAGEEDEPKRTVSKKLTGAQKRQAKAAVSKAAEYRQFFDKLLALEQLK